MTDCFMVSCAGMSIRKCNNDYILQTRQDLSVLNMAQEVLKCLISGIKNLRSVIGSR